MLRERNKFSPVTVSLFTNPLVHTKQTDYERKHLQHDMFLYEFTVRILGTLATILFSLLSFTVHLHQ